MGRNVTRFVIVLFLVVCIATPVLSLGLGFSVSYISAHKTYFDYKSTMNPPDVDCKLNGISFVLETAVARDTLFNYRMEAGIELPVDAEQDIPESFTVFNTLGFSLFCTHRFKLWIGPEIGLYLYTGWDESEAFLIGYGASLGVVAGLNVHVGRVFTFNLTAGVRKRYGYEESDNRDYSTDSREVFASVGCLFRIRDVFKR